MTGRRAWATGLAVLALALGLTGCGSEGSAERSGPSPEAASSAEPSPTAQRVPDADVESTFLELTAQHLCEVQSEVYDDPEDLAEAYDSRPDYPGIPEAQVDRLTQRLDQDADFSAALNEELSATCE